MIRTALKSVVAHKMRLAMTALAVTIGVAFIAGTFIFTDTIDRTFSELFDDVYQGQDVIVATETEFDVGFSEGPPLDASVLGVVESVPGVAEATPSVSGFAVIYDNDGEAIVPMGPPTLGGSLLPREIDSGTIALRDGRIAAASDEVAVDAKTASANDLAVGDAVKVQTVTGVDEFEIVGIVGFGDSDNLAGATFAGFDLATAQSRFDLEGSYSSIAAQAEEGVGADLLRNSIAAALPDGIEAVTAADQAEEASQALSDSLGFIRTALLVFAAVAVFVAAFIIQNTFRIIVRQRQRELALLRAVGATGGQVVGLVVIEAIIVGLVASVIGILAGFVIAQGLTAMMGAAGFDMPSTTAPLASRTIVVALLVGVGVTVAAALLPAIRASRIPPVAAMQDTEVSLRMSKRGRLVGGVVGLAAGIGLIASGLLAGGIGPMDALTTTGIGALVVFLAVSMLSSFLIKPLVAVLGAPLPRVDALTGTLAVGNTKRKPRRTATTASALMIGLALVAFFFILGDSIKTSTSQAIEEGLRADYVVAVDGFAGGFSPDLAEGLAEEPDLAAVTALRIGYWDRDGAEEMVMGIDATTVDDTIFLDVQSGSTAALAGGGVLVQADVAEDEGWTVGDTIPMGFVATGLQQMEVVGIYEAASVVQSNFLLGLDAYNANFSGYGSDTDFVLAIKAADGSHPAATRVLVEDAAADYGNVTVRDQVEYREAQEAQIDTLLVMFNALLILAVIIALVGITNTLALSVYERTREVGLLRAVGMTRGQVRRMVRWEAIMVAVIGAILGIVVGLFFGAAVTAALGARGIEVLSVPVLQIASLVLVGAAAGLLAAIFPARRAAGLNVLDAIAYE